MSYFDDYSREFDDALAQDALSQGEYVSAARGQYVAAHGADEPTREWILSPYDTWEKNPFYVGAPGRHPEDDYGDEPLDEDPSFIATTPGVVLDAHWDDEVLF